jgi:hypothetical protein
MNNINSIESLQEVFNSILDNIIKLDKHLYFGISKNKCTTISNATNLNSLTKSLECNSIEDYNNSINLIKSRITTALHLSIAEYKNQPFFLSYINENPDLNLYSYWLTNNFHEMPQEHFDKLIDLILEEQYSLIKNVIMLKSSTEECDLYLYPGKLEEFKTVFKQYCSSNNYEIYPSEIDRIFAVLEEFGYINDYKKSIICIELTSCVDQINEKLFLNKENKTFKQRLYEIHSNIETLIKDFEYYEDTISEKNNEIQKLELALHTVDQQLNTSYLTKWY